MPNIAHRQCCEIVVPRVKASKDMVKKRSSGKLMNSSLKYNTKPQHKGYNAKTKFSKFEPSHTRGSSLKVQKSGVIVLKSKIVDSSVNTLVSGPLRCDNNCVTLIRKRNHQGTCKCGQKRKPKLSAKEIQTLGKIIHPLSNKACTQQVQTATRGTQLLHNKGIPSSLNIITLKELGILENNLKTPMELPEKYSKYEPDNDKYKHLKRDSNTYQSGGSTRFKPSLRYIGPKPWALTNYPTRGPDF